MLKIIPDVVKRQTLRTLSPDAVVRDAARLMLEFRISAVLIVDNERLVGIVTERDMTRVLATPETDPDATTLQAIMTPSPDTIAPDDDARDALELMEIRGYRHLPIVDGERLVGIVSIRDLYASVKRRLADAAASMQKYALGDRFHIE